MRTRTAVRPRVPADVPNCDLAPLLGVAHLEMQVLRPRGVAAPARVARCRRGCLRAFTAAMQASNVAFAVPGGDLTLSSDPGGVVALQSRGAPGWGPGSTKKTADNALFHPEQQTLCGVSRRMFCAFAL